MKRATFQPRSAALSCCIKFFAANVTLFFVFAILKIPRYYFAYRFINGHSH